MLCSVSRSWASGEVPRIVPARLTGASRPVFSFATAFFGVSVFHGSPVASPQDGDSYALYNEGVQWGSGALCSICIIATLFAVALRVVREVCSARMTHGSGRSR